jgi:hypothetical protein
VRLSSGASWCMAMQRRQEATTEELAAAESRCVDV